jgi:hypothetical protein
MTKERKPDFRLSPQVEYSDLPSYYVTSDIPHVLARVRLIDALREVIGERGDLPLETRGQLDDQITDTTNHSLTPYALDLARSLIALEDKVDSAESVSKKKGK